MFVYYFGHVEGTLAEAAQAISDVENEMSVWARLAFKRGEELRTRVDPGAHLPAKEVEITVGNAEWRSGSVIMPINWKATGMGALFPVMNADLVLQPIGPTDTEVVFRGSYEPPLGGFGRLLDRAVMHRLAEASAKTFLDKLCEAVEETIRSNRQQDSNRGSVPYAAMDGGVATGPLGSKPQAG